MKNPMILLSLLFISACATTNSGTNATISNAHTPVDEANESYTPEKIVLPNDAHSLDIYSILNAIKVHALVRLGFEKKFKQEAITSPEKVKYFECVSDKLSNDSIMQLMAPVYKQHIDAPQAEKLAKLLKTPTGIKFSKIPLVAVGIEKMMPKFNSEDIEIMGPYMADFKALSAPALKQDLKDEGVNLGMQLGLQCIQALDPDLGS